MAPMDYNLLEGGGLVDANRLQLVAVVFVLVVLRAISWRATRQSPGCEASRHWTG